MSAHADFDGTTCRSPRGSGPLALGRVGRAWCIAFLILFGVADSAWSQDRLSTYGYIDFETEWSDKNETTENGTFDQFHFNLINIFQVDPRWRVFSEIEFVHGPIHKPNNAEGVIVLERAWIEYRQSGALKIRAGRFLTGFGIYNLSHAATPTYLSTRLPESFYGTHPNTTGGRQTGYSKLGNGIQFLGDVSLGNWTGTWEAYVSNGRGPNSGEQDQNANKGVGGRFFVGSPSEGVIVGASVYRDRNGMAADTLQEAYAVDLTLNRGAFSLEFEGIMPRLERVTEAREPTGAFRTGFGYYGQASYAFRNGITPFARFEKYDPDRDRADDHERAVVAGLNYAVTGNIFLKSEVHFRDYVDPTVDSVSTFLSSIAVAF